MAEISTLVLAVDSRQVRGASADLDKLSAAGRRTEQSSARVTDAFRGLNNVLGGVTAGLAVRAIIQSADAYANLNARLRLVTSGSQEFARAQTEVFRVAQETSTGLVATADLFGSLSRATEQLGVSQREVIGVTETINKALAVSGTSAQASAAALIQLGQGFASGVLRGEELNSVLEQAPRLAKAIADGLGVPIGQLRKLGEEGALTAEKVFGAIQKSGTAINGEFSQLPLTIGRATTQAANAFTKLIGVIDETSGATSSLAGLISDAAEAISGFADEIRKVAEGQESVSLLANSFVNVSETVQVLAANVAFVFSGIGREIGAVAAQIVALANLDISGFNAISRAVKEDADRARVEIDRLTAQMLQRAPAPDQPAGPKPPTPAAPPTQPKGGSKRDPFGDAIKSLKQQIALTGQKTELEQINARINLGNFGKLSKGQADRLRGLAAELDAVQELQAQNDSRAGTDISAIRRQLDSLTSAYGAAEEILEAQRQAGIVSEAAYYEAKRGFIQANTQAQVAALAAENQRLAAQRLIGDEAIRAQEEIKDNEQAIARLRIDAGAQTAVLGIQQKASFDAAAASIRAARDSLEGYLSTLTKAQSRDVEGLGLGNRERGRQSGRAQVEDDFEQQRRSLARQRREAEFAGTFDASAQNRYEEELRLLNEFQRKALTSFDTYYANRLAKEGDFNTGASEALQNYIAEVENVAKRTEQVFSTAFVGLEDVLTTFVTTGKLSFTELGNSLVQSISRNIIQQQLAGLFKEVGTLTAQGGPLSFLGDVAGSLLGSKPVAGAVSGAVEGAADVAQTAALTAAITGTSAAEVAAITAAITATSAAEAAASTASSAASTAAIAGAVGASTVGLSATIATTAAAETAAIVAAIAASAAAITTAVAASGAASGGTGIIGSLLSGGRAIGGPVSAGNLYRINEKGPGEILNAGGMQYLLAGQNGKVTPQGSTGGNTVNVTVNQSFPANTSRATTLQAASDARRALETAGRNL